jgi:LysM repeat protein
MQYQKTVFVLFLSMISFNLFAAKQGVVEAYNTVVDTTSSDKNSTFSASSLIESVIKYGKSFLYTPYHFGSSNGLSFDCSGFTSYIYNSFGYKLDHSSAGQANQFPAVDRNHIKVGDLVYFSGHKRSKNRIGHVGMVVTANEDGTFEFIHAATSKGITISSSQEPYYAQRYIMANRVVGNNPLIDGAASYKSEQFKTQVTPIPFAEPMSQVSKIIPEKYHKVKKGETVASIAKHYGITVEKLMSINNKKHKKIHAGEKIKILDQESVLIAEPLKLDINSQQNKSYEKNEQNSLTNLETKIQKTLPKSHLVNKGETFYSIAKMYNITVEQLMAANPKSTILYAGQSLSLKIVESAQTKTELNASKVENTNNKHTVKWGETLFSIANEYNISVEELQEMNSMEGKTIIKEGQVLIVSERHMVSNQTNQVSERSIRQKENQQVELHHKVVKGDTFFSIARQYGCTTQQLKEWNSLKAEKLYVGTQLRIVQNIQ